MQTQTTGLFMAGVNEVSIGVVNRGSPKRIREGRFSATLTLFSVTPREWISMLRYLRE